MKTSKWSKNQGDVPENNHLWENRLENISRRICNFIFLSMSAEEFKKCIDNENFLGIVEKFPQDPEELKSLREMLEVYKKQI